MAKAHRYTHVIQIACINTHIDINALACVYGMCLDV